MKKIIVLLIAILAIGFMGCGGGAGGGDNGNGNGGGDTTSKIAKIKITNVYDINNGDTQIPEIRIYKGYGFPANLNISDKGPESISHNGGVWEFEIDFGANFMNVSCPFNHEFEIAFSIFIINPIYNIHYEVFCDGRINEFEIDYDGGNWQITKL